MRNWVLLFYQFYQMYWQAKTARTALCFDFFWGIGGTKYATISSRILEVQNFLPWPTPFLVLSVPHESSRDPAQSISGASMDRPALAAQNQHQQGGRGDSRSDFIDHGVSGEAGGRSCPICYNCGVEVICRRLVTSFRKDPLIQMQMSLLSQGYWPGCTSSCPWAKNCELYSMCMSQALLCQCPVPVKHKHMPKTAPTHVRHDWGISCFAISLDTENTGWTWVRTCSGHQKSQRRRVRLRREETNRQRIFPLFSGMKVAQPSVESYIG